MSGVLPYRIAVLCYLFDPDGRTLLLHRVRPPNQHLYSPVGGKLDVVAGESPTACAVREIGEETGISAAPHQLHLTGIVSETGYLDQAHWLMFLYELLTPVTGPLAACAEGELGWFEPAAIDRLPIPQTDAQVIWPLFWSHRGSFFAVHIDCRGGKIQWRVEQPASQVTSHDIRVGMP